MHEAGLPRLAVYSTWGSTQDVGWVRYAFDQFETPYDLIFKERVRQGDLRAAYDVIVIPSQGRSAKGLVYDIAPKKQAAALHQDGRVRNSWATTVPRTTSPAAWVWMGGGVSQVRRSTAAC